MNHWVGMGRLTAAPEVRYTSENLTIARYTLAIDRQKKEKETDFIHCTTFGKAAEFAEKYLQKGQKIAVEGRIQTGSYEKDGHRYYTFDVIVEKHFFCESKGSAPAAAEKADDFMNVPEGSIDDEVPFK